MTWDIRHFSHLIAIYPLFLLDTDNPQDLPLIETSFNHWLKLGYGTPNFNGYSYTAASSIYSALGNGDKALEALNAALKMFTPSTMYLEGAPVIETPFSAAESIHNMLLDSHNGILRVFPAVPGAWKNAAFHNLRAEGAFLVSAKRMDGKTKFVRIKSLAGEKCFLKTDLARPIHFTGPSSVALHELKNGIIELNLKAGEEVALYSGQNAPEFKITPVVEPAANPFGLK